MRCPTCSCPIIRTGGCLKMTCGLCKSTFNWQIAVNEIDESGFSAKRPDMPPLWNLWSSGDPALFNKLVSFYFHDCRAENCSLIYTLKVILVLLTFPIGYVTIKYKEHLGQGCIWTVYPIVLILALPLVTLWYILMLVIFPFSQIWNCTCFKKSESIENYMQFYQQMNHMGVERRRLASLPPVRKVTEESHESY